jgi:hypothetical protein
MTMAEQEQSREEPRPISKDEWDSYAAHVTQEMKPRPFVTPISKTIDAVTGEPWGTGNYIRLGQEPYLLTNEHVAEALKTHALAHQFGDCEKVFRATNPFKVVPWPLDVAVSQVETSVWKSESHGSAMIPEEKWALAHAPVAGEILFLKGYKGAGVPFLFGTLITNATRTVARKYPFLPTIIVSTRAFTSRSPTSQTKLHLSTGATYRSLTGSVARWCGTPGLSNSRIISAPGALIVRR